jgi:hypothetical protein
MEVVWWLHIHSGPPDDSTDVLKHLGVLNIYIYIYIYICCVLVCLDNKLYKMHGT